MSDRFIRVTADRDFRCEWCRGVVLNGETFYRDTLRRVGPRQLSARTCATCWQNTLAGGSEPASVRNIQPNQAKNSQPNSEPRRATIFDKARESSIQHDLNAALARVAALELKLELLETLLFNTGFMLNTAVGLGPKDVGGNYSTYQFHYLEKLEKIKE